MKKVYEFLGDFESIANGYFNFFYEKGLYSFENINVKKRSDYEKIRGQRKELKGREDLFKEAFYPIVHEYESLNQETIESFIYQIESAMLRTDSAGRDTIVRRVTRRIGTIFLVGKRGITEMMSYEYTNEENVLRYTEKCIIPEEAKEKPEIITLPMETIEILDAISKMTAKFVVFARNFKILCIDFGADCESVAEVLGFENLKELTEIHSRYKKNNIGKESAAKNEFSNNRKRIAIEALLGGVDITRGALGNVSSAKMYRFANLLTGKGTRDQKADNMPTKDMFSNKPKSKDKIQEDNEFVAYYFSLLGLNSIADEIKSGRYD